MENLVVEMGEDETIGCCHRLVRGVRTVEP
jgi:hypothetical protein